MQLKGQTLAVCGKDELGQCLIDDKVILSYNQRLTLTIYSMKLASSLLFMAFTVSLMAGIALQIPLPVERERER